MEVASTTNMIDVLQVIDILVTAFESRITTTPADQDDKLASSLLPCQPFLLFRLEAR